MSACPTCAAGGPNIFSATCAPPNQARWVSASSPAYPNWPPHGTYAAALALVNGFDLTTIDFGQCHNYIYAGDGSYTESTTTTIAPGYSPIYLAGGTTQEIVYSSSLGGLIFAAWSWAGYQEQTGFGRDDGSQYIRISRSELNITNEETYAIGVWSDWIQAVYPYLFGANLNTDCDVDNPDAGAPVSCSNGDVTSPPSIVSVPIPSTAGSPITGGSGLYTVFSVLWQGGTCSDPP